MEKVVKVIVKRIKICPLSTKQCASYTAAWEHRHTEIKLEKAMGLGVQESLLKDVNSS